jgi:hypothetical protein
MKIHFYLLLKISLRFSADLIPQLNTRTLPILPVSKTLPITISLTFGGQSEQMLRSLELQISSSFRRSFIPIYQRSIIPTITSQRLANSQCKISQTSSSRMSSVLSLRKRDCMINQTNTLTIQDIQNRLSVPPVYKQHRQSVLTTN